MGTANMPKWKKDATEFTVSLNFHKTRGYQATIPRPVVEKLADRSKLTFRIKGERVTIT
jgi:hypothetical protein